MKHLDRNALPGRRFADPIDSQDIDFKEIVPPDHQHAPRLAES